MKLILDGDHEDSIYSSEKEAQKARESGFWCDGLGYVWYKTKRLGPVFREEEWDPKDLEHYHKNCAGS